jgi:hypothetical protein
VSVGGVGVDVDVWGLGRLPPQQALKKFEQTCEMPMAAASRPHGRGRGAEDRAVGGRRAGRQAMEAEAWRWEAMQCDAI